ncbi:MAG: YbaK/EbsC family protein [Acidobacteriota bacterium]|nr:YbaK/EbsC family protein [Acidobacteriota bacterium]
MACAKLKEFLEDHGVHYALTPHSPAVTASEVAEAAHISGTDFAKTVIVKIEGEMAMVVVPANRKINPGELRELLNTDSVVVATEDEFRNRFPDCELGAMPPFGNLYGLPVYLETTLANHEEIAFNAGTHREVIRMRSKDFVHLVNPMIMDVAAA